MNIHKHLKVTYDNYRRYFSDSSFNSNTCAFYKSQIKEKDNRPAHNCAVIF